ncbi:DUF1127 domain-containing protein [Billgrantia desiderata]|nr:DUF1127 domain-containing protein [Halomonas desiderata]OUE43336.1 hypothetical protein BZY95_08155 [Halomonas desiderata SP1]
MNMKATIAREDAPTQRESSPRGRLRFMLQLWRWARRMDRLVQLRHERSQLLELSDHQLRDIGLTRHEAARESRRHFWDDIGWRR